MIIDYFKEVKDAIQNFAHIITDFSTQEKTYSDEKGFISGELFFVDDSKLDFAEVKEIGQESKIKYRYHYMDEEKKLIFRYDNAKHYPNLSTFPNHKHTPQGVIESEAPDMEMILKEIEAIVVD
ncbi:MAG: DUF6516 family protein [Bacteroidota bacterium]